MKWFDIFPRNALTATTGRNDGNIHLFPFQYLRQYAYYFILLLFCHAVEHRQRNSFTIILLCLRKITRFESHIFVIRLCMYRYVMNIHPDTIFT